MQLITLESLPPSKLMDLGGYLEGMDADAKAEFEKLAEAVDGYEFGSSVERSTWSTNAYLGFGTDVHLVTAQEDGPNVVILAGQHGIEPSGWKGAEAILEMEPDCGSLKIIPCADPTAREAGRYSGSDGNFNRQWNVGGEPSTEQAANLWAEITAHDPDLVMDLHSSQGIYGRGTGVGQCVFPTPGATDLASTVIDRLNATFDWGASHEVTQGNTQGGGSPGLLSHKVGADLDGAEGLLCEPTREDTSLAQRVKWQTEVVEAALEEYGIQLS